MSAYVRFLEAELAETKAALEAMHQRVNSLGSLGTSFPEEVKVTDMPPVLHFAGRSKADIAWAETSAWRITAKTFGDDGKSMGVGLYTPSARDFRGPEDHREALAFTLEKAMRMIADAGDPK